MNWQEACADVLRGNQITSKGFRYTRPAPHVYEQQWLWDSCFHAVVYRWFDPEMAWDELASVVHAQVQTGADTGMIPHMTYWQGGGTVLWREDTHSDITQPPLIATAAHLVHAKAPDTERLRGLYAPLCAYHDWFARRRDPDQDGLVMLLHPWESGWDASPRWDVPMGLNKPTNEASKAARHALVKTLHAHDMDAVRLQALDVFAVEPSDFNAIRAADLEALADIAALLGEDSTRWREEAQRIQQAVREKLVRADGVCDLMGADETPLFSPSAAQFVLLFGGCVTQAQAEQLVLRLQSADFWTRYPVSTVASTHPDFDPSSYWRGNVWLSVNWLIWRGLKRYGYDSMAQELAARTAELVERHGFYEYFNAVTGEGYGPGLQSWTTLILDMLNEGQ